MILTFQIDFSKPYEAAGAASAIKQLSMNYNHNTLGVFIEQIKKFTQSKTFESLHNDFDKGYYMVQEEIMKQVGTNND